jgi:hypothetical protein
MSNYEVLDYYEYVQNQGGYMKTSVVQYVAGEAYYKTTQTILTTNLADEEIGFDVNGNVYFIDKNQNLYGVQKNSTSVQNIATGAKELAFDNNSFVIGFYTVNGQLNNFNSQYNGSNNNYGSSWNGSNTNGSSWNGNSNNGSNWNGSNTNGSNWNGNSNNGSSWNGSNTNGSNWNGNSNNGSSWNGSNTNGSSWNNSGNANYPFLTTENNMLTYVESSSERHTIYVDNDHLVFNQNIILYKHGVKAYAFAKDGVVYITKADKLVYYKFGTKKQYVVAKKVSNLQYDNNGFCIGYTKADGKSYSL